LFTLCSANGAEFGLVVIGAKKVIMEWTDEKVSKLIKLYESYPLVSLMRYDRLRIVTDSLVDAER